MERGRRVLDVLPPKLADGSFQLGAREQTFPPPTQARIALAPVPGQAGKHLRRGEKKNGLGVGWDKFSRRTRRCAGEILKGIRGCPLPRGVRAGSAAPEPKGSRERIAKSPDAKDGRLRHTTF
jgi:hypothetical protein